MKWAATPTDWYTDLGLDEAGERAEILHRRAWDFAGHQETGGFIPASMVARLCPTHTKARVAALVGIGKWVEVEGGYQLAEWDSVYEDLKSLLHRRKSDTERQRRHRAKQRDVDTESTAERDPSQPRERDEKGDESRGLSRDSHGVDKNRDNPPNPPASRGANCDPISKPHPHCRGCGTSRRAGRQQADADAAQAAVQADLELRAAAKNAPHCGHPDCDPNGRWRTTPTGQQRCPECNEVEILKRANRPPLIAVAGGR